MNKLIDDTLKEIGNKIEILSDSIAFNKINLIETVIKTDVLQTLILSEYKLRDKNISIEEKYSLCETIELLFAQVGKITKQGERR